jgi:ERCC4-type nuclease
VGSNRERFARECHRLRGFTLKRLVIIGSEEEILSGRYHSNIKPQSIIGTLRAFEVRYDLPVVFSPTPESAALQIERWAYYFSREMTRITNDLYRGCSGTPT